MPTHAALVPFRNRIVGSGLEAPDQLLANPKNWRVHPKEQQDALEGILHVVGWVQQVIVNRTTGFVVDGHLRVALALRRDAPPVDPEVLDEAPPLPEEPTSRRGDLYQLGRHRLLCGDATEPADWTRLMGAEHADMLATDPPYDVKYVGKTADQLTIQNDALGFDGTLALLRASIRLATAHMREGGGLYVFAPHGPQFLPFAIVGAEQGWWRQTILWVKDAFALGRSDYHYKHEAVLEGVARSAAPEAEPLEEVPREVEAIGYGWVPGAKHIWSGDRKQSTAWECPRPKRSAEHPTMKPVALLERALRNSSAKGGSVVDCFAGSGSTLIAAEATGRRCFAMELDPRYVDVILARFERITGHVPRQIGLPNA